MGRRKSASETNDRNYDVMILDLQETRCINSVDSKFHSSGRPCAQDGRGQKMDLSKMRQCSTILKKLMEHQAGWLFNQPVDPIKFRIPDYFTIISKPMDLGTIRRKLDRKQYWSTGQFAADVRLTFANAMQYNPPENEVHMIAEELNNIFNSKWQLLEENWRKEQKVCHEETEIMGTTEQTPTSRKIISRISGPKKPPLPRRSLTDAEKLQLRKDLAKIPFGDMSPRLVNILEKTCSVRVSKNRMELDTSVVDEEKLWKLQKIIKIYADAPKIKTANVKEQCSKISTQDSCEGAIRSSTSRSDTRQDKPNSSMCAPTDNLDLPDVERLPFEEPQSPSKALRAVMLKSRFADTIVKAQHKALLSNGEKVDLVKLQQEREKLEKKQKEERARIEAQVKEVQAAAAKAEAQLKMQREKEREAARLALQNMEKTVDIDENVHILEEYELLACVPVGSWFGEPDEMVVDFVNGCHLQSNMLNPLEKLGLFMKNDLDEDVVDKRTEAMLNEDVEEGEICAS